LPLNHYRRWVAANGAAPPGAEATPVTSALAEHPVGLFADRPRRRHY
jgi:hypothetical protein